MLEVHHHNESRWFASSDNVVECEVMEWAHAFSLSHVPPTIWNLPFLPCSHVPPRQHAEDCETHAVATRTGLKAVLRFTSSVLSYAAAYVQSSSPEKQTERMNWHVRHPLQGPWSCASHHWFLWFAHLVSPISAAVGEHLYWFPLTLPLSVVVSLKPPGVWMTVRLHHCCLPSIKKEWRAQGCGGGVQRGDWQKALLLQRQMFKQHESAFGGNTTQCLPITQHVIGLRDQQYAVQAING